MYTSASMSEAQFSRSSRMEAMREMASAISFDLTDMTTVMQFKLAQVRKALEKGGSNSIALKDIEKIEATLVRMGKIAKGMRSMGLAGEEDGLENVSLKGLVSKILELSRPWFQNQNTQFKAEETPNVIVKCRATQFSQALINLLNNAIEATSLLDQKWVTLGFSLEGSSPVCLKIKITDSGKLSPEIKEKMMEPFFSTKEPGRGMGLGLNVVKSVAEAHSGKLYLDPESEHTCFVFEVPLGEQKSGSA